MAILGRSYPVKPHLPSLNLIPPPSSPFTWQDLGSGWESSFLYRKPFSSIAYSILLICSLLLN